MQVKLTVSFNAEQYSNLKTLFLHIRWLGNYNLEKKVQCKILHSFIYKLHCKYMQSLHMKMKIRL